MRDDRGGRSGRLDAAIGRLGVAKGTGHKWKEKTEPTRRYSNTEREADMLWRQGPVGWEKDEAEQRGREGIVAEDRLSLTKDGRDNSEEGGQGTCMGDEVEWKEEGRAEGGATGGERRRRGERDGLGKRISKQLRKEEFWRTFGLALLVRPSFYALLPFFPLGTHAGLLHAVLHATETRSGIVALLAGLLAVCASVLDLSTLCTLGLNGGREGIH